MRVGILTNVETRHRFFVNMLRRKLPVVAVGYEQAVYSPAKSDGFDLTAEEKRIFTEHFEERSRQEEAFFGHDAEPVADSADCRVRELPQGNLSHPDTVAFLESAGVDTLAVFGANLLKPPLLGRWPERTVNMHLGLSPWYRGTATNFYPLLNEEPEYVGATIHLIDAGIDRGPILRHARPDIVAGDRPHTIGCKAISAGTDALIDAVLRYDAGEIKPKPQWHVENARLYLRKDFHPRQIVELYRKLDDGMIERYVENAHDLELPARDLLS